MATRSAIATQIAQNVTDNTNFENTPARVRAVLNNLNTSGLNYDTDVLSGVISKNVGGITNAQLTGLLLYAEAIPNAYYIVTDSVYGFDILVQAQTQTSIYPAALDIQNGIWGIYNNVGDVFTPAIGSGAYTPSVTFTAIGALSNASNSYFQWVKNQNTISIYAQINIFITQTTPTASACEFNFNAPAQFAQGSTLATVQALYRNNLGLRAVAMAYIQSDTVYVALENTPPTGNYVVDLIATYAL